MSNTTACLNMIKQQLRTNNITNENIIKLFQNFPRENFTPAAYKQFAYSDMHITLENNQVILTPLEEAKIIQSGQFVGTEKVLLIGSSNIYLTTLLSQNLQNITVVDTCADSIVAGKKLLSQNKIDNVEFILQDSYSLENLDKDFDAIIVTCALESLPQNWLKNLKSQAKIFAPLGETVQNAQWFYIQNQKVTGHEFIFSTHLPPLIETKNKFIF